MDLKQQAEKFKRNKNFIKHKFDFETGYLTKSPCRECDTRMNFPGCLDSCELLQKIHSKLINVISSARSL